jgi:hypothetical protein
VPLCPAWLHEHVQNEWGTKEQAKCSVKRLPPCLGKPLPPVWSFARYRNAGTASAWSLFTYHGARPSRVSLAGHLKVAPESLEFRTLAGDPLAAAEGSDPATSNALLDQALAPCAAGRRSLSPISQAVHSAMPSKRRTGSATVIEILARGPPEGWSAVAYRLRARRGGKPTEAWIPPGLEPAAAIAAALSASPTDITILTQEEPTPKDPWRKPHIVEEPFPDPTEFIVTFGGTKRAWPPPVAPRTKLFSFVELLRPEEGEGVLLTAELCGEPKASAARPASSHVWIH